MVNDRTEISIKEAAKRDVAARPRDDRSSPSDGGFRLEPLTKRGYNAHATPHEVGSRRKTMHVPLHNSWPTARIRTPPTLSLFAFLVLFLVSPSTYATPYEDRFVWIFGWNLSRDSAEPAGCERSWSPVTCHYFWRELALGQVWVRVLLESE